MTHLGSNSSSAERRHFSQVQTSVEDKEGKLDYERSIILIGVPLHLEFSAQSEAKRFRTAVDELNDVLLKILHRHRTRQYPLNARCSRAKCIIVFDTDNVSDVEWHESRPP